MAVISPDGHRILTASVDGALILWELESGRILHRFDPINSYLFTVAFLPDGRHALSGGSDKIVRLLDVERGRVVHELKGHDEWVLSVAPSPDGRVAYSTSGGPDPWRDGKDSAVRVWDLVTGLQVGNFEGHRGRVPGLSVSPDGRRLLTSGADRGVILWDAKSGQIIHRMSGHTDLIECVAFLPDGTRALSGSLDKTIRLWELSSGQEIYKFVGLPYQALWLSVSRDGRSFLSSDYSGHELRLWDLESRKLIHTISWGNVFPTRGCFAPDGVHAVWPGSDGVVRLYRFTDSVQADRPEVPTTPAATGSAASSKTR